MSHNGIFCATVPNPIPGPAAEQQNISLLLSYPDTGSLKFWYNTAFGMSLSILPLSLHNSKQYFQQKAFKNTDWCFTGVNKNNAIIFSLLSIFPFAIIYKIFPKMGWIYFQFTFINHTISQILQVFDKIFDGLGQNYYTFWLKKQFICILYQNAFALYVSKQGHLFKLKV